MTVRKNGRPLMLEGKRTRFVKARVTEEEFLKMQSMWVSLGLKESDFLRMKMLGGPSGKLMVNASLLLSTLDGIGAEIGRSGNNINQLARHANVLDKRGELSADVVSSFNGQFSEYIKCFREMEKTLRELLRLLKS